VPLEKYMQLKPYQILNHFPGMGEICRKDSLARNIQKLRRVRRDEFNILPMTWILPSEFGALSHFIKELKRRRRSKTFIIKPPNGAMGNGSVVRFIAHYHCTLASTFIFNFSF
jgi:tubulin polyglutamylase TTLL7